jgi:ectoine hydroxylase-related dioxygenase (phytanoyl-CoA dioxygenase family)
VTVPLAERYRQALDGDGFIVVPNVLDEGWRARLLRAFEDALAQSSGTQHVTLSDATPDLAAWNALSTHPLVLAAAEHILRRRFRVRDLHGRNPLPGFGQQGLHVDWVPRAAGDPYSVVTAIWMIDAFTAENGATRVVPGSHRLLHSPPAAYAQPLARHPGERIVTGKAGDVLIFNGHLWHSGRRNDSTGPRRAAQMVIEAAEAGTMG